MTSPGTVLYEFFKVFAEEWDYEKWAVSCNGKIERKAQQNQQKKKKLTVSIISFLDKSDIGVNIQKFGKIREVFQIAWRVLKEGKLHSKTCDDIADSILNGH